MYQLIEFIEQYAFDEQLYLVVRSRDDENTSFELWWDKSHGKQPWWWRPVSLVEGSLVERDRRPPWNHSSALDIPILLAQAGISVEHLKELLNHHAIQQVVFADTVRERGERLFGKHVVREARRQHQAFLARLTGLVQKECGGNDRVVEGEGQSTARRRGHLRLIEGQP